MPVTHVPRDATPAFPFPKWAYTMLQVASAIPFYNSHPVLLYVTLHSVMLMWLEGPLQIFPGAVNMCIAAVMILQLAMYIDVYGVLPNTGLLLGAYTVSGIMLWCRVQNFGIWHGWLEGCLARLGLTVPTHPGTSASRRAMLWLWSLCHVALALAAKAQLVKGTYPASIGAVSGAVGFLMVCSVETSVIAPDEHDMKIVLLMVLILTVPVDMIMFWHSVNASRLMFYCCSLWTAALLHMELHGDWAIVQQVSQQVQQLPAWRAPAAQKWMGQGADVQNCAVCLEMLTKDAVVRRLPCNAMHCFHQECIDRWLKDSHSCPMCRTPVRPALQTQVEGGV